MVGVAAIGGSQQSTIVFIIGCRTAEMLLVAVGHGIIFGIPVTGTPGGLSCIFERQSIILQHIESHEELLGVLSTSKYRVERYRSTGSLLDEGITELDFVGTSRERHTTNHERHYSRNNFMM